MELYDTIVVGAGTVGCVVAARLGEDPRRRVLLFEAGGGDVRGDVEDPRAWPATIGSGLDFAARLARHPIADDPNRPSPATPPATVMIGEKAADLLRAA